MDFNPNNTIVQYCIRGMIMEAQGHADKAAELLLQAWNEASNNFEKYLAAYFMARHQTSIPEKLKWFETALEFALITDNIAVKGSLHTLYSSIAECYEQLSDPDNAKKNRELALSSKDKLFDKGPFYHGTRADLKVGDLLTPGNKSNYQQDLVMNHIYFTALPDGAGLAASLAKGDGHERVYIVEPTGSFENDPNVTDKKFPGNLTRSYRTLQPLKIVGEITDWAKQTPENLREWREKLANNNGEIIN
jgi:rifampin ADP-ribosylating transferase